MQVLFSGAIPDQDNPSGRMALLGVLDTRTGDVHRLLTYEPPAELRSPGQKVQFTGYWMEEDEILVCTHNEILRLTGWPPSLTGERFSLPTFNDLHHCMKWRGDLVVANTGLETVDRLSLQDGRLLERWDLLEEVSDPRPIRADVDYRLIRDTKPHRKHGNHVFELDGRIWVTQLLTSDAVSVEHPGARIQIPVGNPHDGTRIGEDLVFTTTNGHVVKRDATGVSPKPRVWNLADMTPGLRQLGWCRGVCSDPSDPRRVFVAFTMIRRSKWKEFAFWSKHGHYAAPSRIGLYDLSARRLVASWNLGKGTGYVIFQLHPLTRDRWL